MCEQAHMILSKPRLTKHACSPVSLDLARSAWPTATFLPRNPSRSIATAKAALCGQFGSCGASISQRGRLVSFMEPIGFRRLFSESQLALKIQFFFILHIVTLTENDGE
jgi:hypothetical protein